ncbi:Retrovirus-related Pol polyprotein from transposon TNT 1-94 [Vitis vinifera]|uniref:Retrovirus-related Pol polyprotein from transposon TNT 1-94 n=1 Tax=Vitis vinifera TaxID=29760 RepID=A0A438D2L7_VITVI|nr:Retrovirus-related Pol polyprotein from transposon TNT 1-94 [Vitis vinifera]
MLETEWKTTTREQEWKFSKPSKSFQDETVSSLTATTNEYISAHENLSFTKEQLDLLYKIMGKSEELTSGKMIGSAKERNGLYYLDIKKGGKVQAYQIKGTAKRFFEIKGTAKGLFESYWLMHEIVGHPSFAYLQHCINLDNSSSSVKGVNWQKIIRTTWMYLLKGKSESIPIFQNFYKMIQTQFGVQIQVISSDNGTKNFNESLSTCCTHNGIIHQSTCVDTPQQNGVAERKNRHLLEVARALMFARNVLMTFWEDAILTAVKSP